MYKKESAIKVGWYSKKFEYSQDFDLTLKLLKKNDIYFNLGENQLKNLHKYKRQYFGYIDKNGNRILL